MARNLRGRPVHRAARRAEVGDPACGTERPTLATLSTPGGLVVRQVGDPWSGPVTVSSAASCIRRDASLDGDRFYRLGDPVDPGTFAEVVLRVE